MHVYLNTATHQVAKLDGGKSCLNYGPQAPEEVWRKGEPKTKERDLFHTLWKPRDWREAKTPDLKSLPGNEHHSWTSSKWLHNLQMPLYSKMEAQKGASVFFNGAIC